MVHDERPLPFPRSGLRYAPLWRKFWQTISRHRLEDWMVSGPGSGHRELRKVHQYDVFSTGAPIQAGLVSYLATEEAEDHLRTVGPI